jgi:ketosteroid isomerase-like protein
MTIQTLLDMYYNGLAGRAGWEEAIADDFAFTGANKGNDTRGKAAYAEVIRQFSRMFETVAVKRQIVDGSTACVIATYGAVSPSGKKTAFDVAEVWEAQDGRLASLAIYFDTAGWRSFNAS